MFMLMESQRDIKTPGMKPVNRENMSIEFMYLTSKWHILFFPDEVGLS